MNLKDTRSQWLAGLLLASALGLGIAIYQVTSSPAEGTTPRPMGHELHDNAAKGLAPPSDSGPSAPALMAPLLNNRRNRSASAEQALPNVPLNINEPAQAAAEMPPATAAPGSPTDVGNVMPKSMATEKSPPGIPVTTKNLAGTSEALRNDSP